MGILSTQLPIYVQHAMLLLYVNLARATSHVQYALVIIFSIKHLFNADHVIKLFKIVCSVVTILYVKVVLLRSILMEVSVCFVILP